MAEFKKGNRVIGNDIFSGGCVYGTLDSGGRFVAWPWHPTKIDDEPKPLRFEDVRDGDTITVEGEDYSITGTSWTEPGDPPRVTVGGVTVFNFDGDEGTHGPYGPPVRLTAHTPAPAEPEWHRAKVIKADFRFTPRKGCFLTRSTEGGWRDGEGEHAYAYELTNVTIIVDAEGLRRA